jgi:putative hydrolase of the HAD superfamily
MAIVSNGNTEVIINRLEKAKIKHHFEFILAPCEEFQLTKPDEKIFKESLKKVGTNANETIFVGDNPIADVEGANKVGMFTVLIDRENHHKNLEGFQIPDLKVSNFKEMLHLFD